jgi:hypothetical protein
MKEAVIIDFISKEEIKPFIPKIKEFITKSGIIVNGIDLYYVPIIPPPYCGVLTIKFEEPKFGMMEKLQPKFKEFLYTLGINALSFRYVCLVPPSESGTPK